MKNIKIKKYLVAILIAFATFFGVLPIGSAYADTQFALTPMKQKIILMPGEVYQGSLGIVNPASSVGDFNYKLVVAPFSVDNNNEVVFENDGDYNQIVDWITVEDETGTVAPNTTKTVRFTINTPKNAPAGGQYASIIVTNDDSANTSGNVNIQTVTSISHLIFAEVAGSTEKNGEIISANIPGFLISDNISGVSTIKNTGNVHGTAKYTLQVFPLFSDEEVYTNEETPEEHIVMPYHEYANITTWNETPYIGLFNVKYTVEFEGVTTEVTKLVIKCPLWLIFVIIFMIIAMIAWLVARSKSRKKAKKSSEKSVDIA